MNDERQIPSDDGANDLQELQWAVTALRETPEVSAAWRSALAAALADERVAAPPITHRLSLRPVMALAAALAFMAVGSVLTVLASRPRASVATNDPAMQTPARMVDRAVADEGMVGVRFAVVAPGAKRVSLVGDFNQWDATANVLQLARDGVTWTALLPLSAGRHTYAFVIDGEIMADPTAPKAADDDFGVPNSMVLVGRLQ